MSGSLLEKTRKLNSIIQNAGHVSISFSRLCTILQSVLDSNVYVVSKKGKVLGYGRIDDRSESKLSLGKSCNDELLSIKETAANEKSQSLVEIFRDWNGEGTASVCVVPIIGSGQRLGTLIASRSDSEFAEEDVILSEYAATVVGMEILRAKSDEIEEEERKKSVVTMALGTLSYSELEAIEHIFEELGGFEGKLVASKIADRVGITRSVIVNALRKFESAGVIESRSLGMKGTYIKVLNDKLFDELKRSR